MGSRLAARGHMAGAQGCVLMLLLLLVVLLLWFFVISCSCFKCSFLLLPLVSAVRSLALSPFSPKACKQMFNCRAGENMSNFKRPWLSGRREAGYGFSLLRKSRRDGKAVFVVASVDAVVDDVFVSSTSALLLDAMLGHTRNGPTESGHIKHRKHGSQQTCSQDTSATEFRDLNGGRS